MPSSQLDVFDRNDLLASAAKAVEVGSCGGTAEAVPFQVYVALI
jgi:hypothetical protein